MSLPDAWTDRIFTKLTLVYGQKFLRQWAEMNIADVKTDWAHELSGFAQRPQAIAYALQNLPADRPPNVLEFRAICRRTPIGDGLPQIASAPADPERVARELAKLNDVKKRELSKDHKQWARDIIERSNSGKNVPTYTVLLFAKQALGLAK